MPFILLARSAITLLPLEGAALYQQQPADESEGPSTSNENVDVEALSNNSNGVVFFNGGIYSAGPDFIGGCCIVLCKRLLLQIPLHYLVCCTVLKLLLLSCDD